MAVILDGAGDSYLIADHASLDVPDDDWFIMFWCRPTNLNAGEAGSIQQFYNHAPFSVSNDFLHINCEEDSDANPNTVSGGAGAESTWLGGDGDDGQNRLVCLTYDAANDLLWCKNTVEGGASVASGSVSLANGAFSPSGDLAIGRRIQDHSREFHGWFGELLKGRGLFINDANLLDAANGNGLDLSGATIDFYYEFETSQAIEPNVMGAVGDATREGNPTSAGAHFPKLIAAAGEAAGSAAGQATVSGEGAATAEAAGSAAGVATATGAAGGDVEGAGQAAGQATVSGEGAATAEAAGASTGSAQALGIADAGGAPPPELIEAPRFLVEIEFDSGTTRLWNGLGTLEALGESWTGLGRLVGVSPIRETQDVVASGVVFELLIVPTEEIPDAPDAFLNLALAEEYQGRPVTVYQARLDPDTLALTADPFVRFKGRLDVMEDVEIPGAALLRVSAENRLIDLERPKKRTYTPEDQKAFYPGDTFFDEVAPLQNREVVLE